MQRPHLNRPSTLPPLSFPLEFNAAVSGQTLPVICGVGCGVYKLRMGSSPRQAVREWMCDSVLRCDDKFEIQIYVPEEIFRVLFGPTASKKAS